MIDDNESIRWPAVIRHGDDPELSYIPDRSAWQEFLNDDLSMDDSLIDSAGHHYSIDSSGDDPRLEAVGSVTLSELLGLVKAHAAHRGSCCVAKLYAPTIAEAMKIVASLED